MKKLLIATMLVLFTVGVMAAPVSAGHDHDRDRDRDRTETEVVMPADLALDDRSWYFYDDVANTASTAEVPGKYEFVAGIGTPPAGKGSIKFTNTGTERWNIATAQYAGTKIAHLKDLKYSTYQPNTNPGDTTRAIYLNFDVDFDGPGGNDAYQGRLVFVPRDNGTVQQNTWQKWDTISPTAVWNWSRFAGNGNQWPDGNTNPNRLWTEVVAAFPNATVSTRPDAGQLLFRSGEPYPDGFTGYVDRAVVKVKGDDRIIYDFDPSLKPTTREQCLNGGWRTFNDPSFDSQRECVRFVEHPNSNHHHKHWHKHHSWHKHHHWFRR